MIQEFFLFRYFRNIDNNSLKSKSLIKLAQFGRKSLPFASFDAFTEVYQKRENGLLRFSLKLGADREYSGLRKLASTRKHQLLKQAQLL